MTQRHFCTFWLKLLYWELFVLWLFYLHIIVSDFVFMRGMCVCVSVLFVVLKFWFVSFCFVCLLVHFLKGKRREWCGVEWTGRWKRTGRSWAKWEPWSEYLFTMKKKRNKFLETGFIYFIFKWNSFSKYWDKSTHLNTYTHIKFHSNNFIASYAHILHK